jgi:uncharacterized membrane protein YjdF
MKDMSVTLRALCVLTPLVMAVPGFRSNPLADWWLENLAVFAVLLAMAAAYKYLPLSNLSYLLLFISFAPTNTGPSTATATLLSVNG